MIYFLLLAFEFKQISTILSEIESTKDKKDLEFNGNEGFRLVRNTIFN
jgi:hypothetical protein